LGVLEGISLRGFGEREAESRRPMSRGMAIPGGGDFRDDALEGVLRRHAE